MATAPDERSLDTKNATMVMAMAGRSARACDVCGRERARWYCGADDAYLCGRCDTSVHCVNALASRHERVRLGPNGVPAKGGSDRSDCLPSSKSLSGVHSKKATKGGKHHAQSKLRTTKDDMLTPTFFSYHEDTRVPGYNESLPEDQGTQHVPEFQGSIEGFESSTGYGYVGLNVDQGIPALERGGEVCVDTSDEDEYLDFTDIVTEADFIGDNGDEGLVFNQDNVKAENVDQFQPAVVEGVECDQLTSVKLEKTSSILSEEVEGKRNLPPLKLDYEEILSAWSGRAPFWTGSDGQPQTVPVFPNMDIALNLDLENFHRETVGEVPVLTMGEASMGEEASEAGGGREARVMRYREKRRTRLFSKQIRYEVRKLNAERRPRMKGRFVKRLPT